MNLQGNAPIEFLRGWLSIHHVMREYSNEGGARVVGSDYIGRVQLRRLEHTLAKTSEDGSYIHKPRPFLFPLIFMKEK